MISLLAALPIIAVIIALAVRLSTTLAAALGLALTLVVMVIAFPLPAQAIPGLVQDWLPVTVEVLLIILGGIAFAELGRRSGGQRVLSDWLRNCLGNGIGPVLAIVHGLTPLAESLTGYGIGAALAIPLLAALGLGIGRAAGIGLLGLCAVPWGSMGPGTLIASQLSGVSFQTLGVLSAVASLPVFLGVGFAAVILAPAPVRLRSLLAAAASAAALWLAVLGANLTLGTAPAGAVGALVVLAGHLLLARLRGGSLRGSAPLRRALVPYAVLLLGVVSTSALVRFGGLEEGPGRYLASPALWLLVTNAVAGSLPGTDVALRRSAWSAAGRGWLHVGPATGMFIVLGALMAASGMSAAMAAGFGSLGAAYALVVPWLAGIGGFVTGSNTGANAMLAGPQTAAIAGTGVPLALGLAVHNVAASICTLAAPARVEMALRLAGSESDRHARADRTWVQSRLLSTLVCILAVLSLGLFGIGLSSDPG